MTAIVAVAVLLVVYQLKHFLADYILQGEYMLGKFKPGWAFLGPLLAHVAVHGGMTLVIADLTFAALAPDMLPGVRGWMFLLAGCDMLVHFFMDRIKAGPKYMGRWKPLSATEWKLAKMLEWTAAGDPMPEWEHVYEYTPEEAQEEREAAIKRLRGNKLFWWCLGFDQMVHHLTHYVLIFAMLRIAGVL